MIFQHLVLGLAHGRPPSSPASLVFQAGTAFCRRQQAGWLRVQFSTPRLISRRKENRGFNRYCMPLLTAALFPMAQRWKQPNSPWTDNG